MTEKDSQKSSTRRTTTKRKRTEEDDGDDDEERPRSMKVGEIVAMMESFTEQVEEWEKKLEERRASDRDWRKRMMDQLEVSNSYAEALKGNMEFQYKEIVVIRGLVDETLIAVDKLTAKKKKRRMMSVGVETEVVVPEATEEDGDGSSTDGERTDGEETDGEKTDDGKADNEGTETGKGTEDGKQDEEEVEEQTLATAAGDEDVQMTEVDGRAHSSPLV